MPKPGTDISCVIVQNQILISSQQFRLLSYDIHNEAYSYVGKPSDERSYRTIASSKEKLYLFDRYKVYEMTKQYEKIDTIEHDHNIAYLHLSFTTSDDMIFFLQRDGLVICFDPFGAKQLTEIKDLYED